MVQPYLPLPRRPETAQDKLVKAYLKQNCPIFRACDELSEEVSLCALNHELLVWADPYADKLYEFKRERLRKSSTNGDQSKIFEIYGDVVNELTATFTGIQLLQNGVPDKSTYQSPTLDSATATQINVLDICMAPGGFAKVILERYKNTHVYGLSLPPSQGGHHLIESQLSSFQHRFKIQYLDITMLASEFGGLHTYTEHQSLSTKRPYNDIKFDLIIADGTVLESHERSQYRTKTVEAVRLMASELLLALQRIKIGGTFVMLLHHINVWETVQILHDFRSFAAIQVKKPTTSHKASSSFYMIAEKVRPTCAAAIAFVAKWKNTWRAYTTKSVEFGQSQDGVGAIESTLATIDIQIAEATDAEVYALLETFGPTLIKMAIPVWETQIEGLNGKKGKKTCGGHPDQSGRLKNYETGSSVGRNDNFRWVTPWSQPGHRHGSSRSDDRVVAAPWSSHISSRDSEKSQAIRGNWKVKRESGLAIEAVAERDRETTRRASAAKIQDIRGKSSWRSRGAGDENKSDITGLVERAGNIRAGK